MLREIRPKEEITNRKSQIENRKCYLFAALYFPMSQHYQLCNSILPKIAKSVMIDTNRLDDWILHLSIVMICSTELNILSFSFSLFISFSFSLYRSLFFLFLAHLHFDYTIFWWLICIHFPYIQSFGVASMPMPIWPHTKWHTILNEKKVKLIYGGMNNSKI